MYACGFRICFTPLPGFFSPFPHGTGSLSVDDEYLALEDGPPFFRQDSTCPALLVAALVPPPAFRIRGSHPLRPPFPERSAKPAAKDCRLLRFRSPLLSESRLISSPRPTEMFQFRRFASLTLWIQARMTLAGRVSPFGHPRITARLPAPRGLSQAATSFIACHRQGIHHMRFARLILYLWAQNPSALHTPSREKHALCCGRTPASDDTISNPSHLSPFRRPPAPEAVSYTQIPAHETRPIISFAGFCL